MELLKGENMSALRSPSFVRAISMLVWFASTTAGAADAQMLADFEQPDSIAALKALNASVDRVTEGSRARNSCSG